MLFSNTVLHTKDASPEVVKIFERFGGTSKLTHYTLVPNLFKYTEPYKRAFPNAYPLKEQWVHDCVTATILLPKTEYLLQASPNAESNDKEEGGCSTRRRAGGDEGIKRQKTTPAISSFLQKFIDLTSQTPDKTGVVQGIPKNTTTAPSNQESFEMVFMLIQTLWGHIRVDVFDKEELQIIIEGVMALLRLRTNRN